MSTLGALRSKVGLAAFGGALLLAGVGAGVAVSSPGTQPASDTTAVTTAAAATSGTAASTTAGAAATTTTQAAAASSAAAPSTTVAGVTSASPDTTTSQPEGQQPDLAPGQDPQGVGTIGSDGNYTPAPDPGRLPLPPALPVKKLPGEPGYTAPASSASDTAAASSTPELSSGSRTG